MEKYTFFDLAREVLQKSGVPMTPDELWNFALAEDLVQKLGTTGKTPQVVKW